MSKIAFNNIAPQKADTILNEVFSKELKTLNEPILKNLRQKDVSVFRYAQLSNLFYTRTYRLVKNKNEIYFISKSKDPSFKNDSVQIHESIFNEITNSIQTIDFFDLNTIEPPRISDGSIWILEVYENQKYHFVIRFSPDAPSQSNESWQFANVCTSFEDLNAQD